MSTITIPKNITGSEELVVISRKELDWIKSQMIPTIYLKGSAAKKLDKRVEKGLRDYRTGKTKVIRSLADLG